MSRVTDSGPGANVAETVAQLETSAADPAKAVGLLAGCREIDQVLARADLGVLATLLDRAVELAARRDATEEDRGSGREILDLARRSTLLRRIPGEEREAWTRRIHRLVVESNFTLGALFRQRAETYASKPLFEFLAGGRKRSLTWRRVAGRVERLSRVLHSLDDDDPGPVALLSENRLELALLDLACLTGGIVNVMVPANATDADVAYILEHSRARSVVVSGEHQLRKVLGCGERLPSLRRVITLDPPAAQHDHVRHLDELVERNPSVSHEDWVRRAEDVRIGDLATIMYTSGTTGTPKGIRFSHENVVFKRFARALALPRIGDRDVFLCFLPLFHTFGRFLEMLGCVFWGARYCFLDNPSAEGLTQGMRRHRPTTFISVPKKWIQLHEQIGQRVDLQQATDDEAAAAMREVTGGRLRWGLSAAGHLDSEIFRFFQRHGVELMSGFGMTEATGGITMTPPGEYVDGSLGLALPGIELRLADDGELLCRGPYVMMGYENPPSGEAGYDPEGWFHTGDLMERDAQGHLRLVDRKKEIYKNIKGETIAPQRIENLFRDFESVGRAFLVGDHREYNTLLIYPNPDYHEREMSRFTDDEVQEHFRSLIVSVNNFLAPYERIVDFALIDRDLEAERNELTAKGTPRRRVVEQSFAESIRSLYRRTNLRVGDAELVFPNWLFQILGLTARAVRRGTDAIELPSNGRRLRVRALDPTHTRVGSSVYRHPPGPLNLGSLLTTPRLWLGNEELVCFVPLDAATRKRTGRSAERVQWSDRAGPFEASDEDRAALAAIASDAERDLLDLDRVARMLASPAAGDAAGAVEVLERVLADVDNPLIEPARLLLGRMAACPDAEVRRIAFRALAPAEKRVRFPEILRRFFDADPDLLDAGARERLVRAGLSDPKITAFLSLADEAAASQDAEVARRACSLVDWLADYGRAHPTTFRRLRAFLSRIGGTAQRAEVRRAAAAGAQRLQFGLRQWLGAPSTVAVDPESGREYGWDDVVRFDRAVPDPDRERLRSALEETLFLQEAVFLFSSGVSIRLCDIALGGVWVRWLGSRHGKSVYRLTVQTRFQGAFDLAANLNQELSPAEVQEEIRWLIVSGDPEKSDALVEEVGGYWPDQDLWSEEFIAGETLDRAMERLADVDGGDRLEQLWPYFAWATLAAYVDFWNRTRRRLEVADPSRSNIVVPIEDFLTGPRIVSVSRRRPHLGLLAMMRAFRDELVVPAEQAHPRLRGAVEWPLVFSSLLEIVGELEGLALFAAALVEEDPGEDDQGMREALATFTDGVSRSGFIPMRVFFAAERYRRWARLGPGGTAQARAMTLQELWETYGLQRLTDTYPEIRVRFFLETVFERCTPTLADGLKRIILAMRDGELPPDELVHALDELRAELRLDGDEEYFLARLSYPHLRPEDAARFVTRDQGGKRQAELVVTIEDTEGDRFRVRHALSPKEVERLLRLYRAARLDVRFRPEHLYLVAINERSQIIGGIYYEIDESGETAHLEKIVVAERLRHRGVAHGLMTQWFHRMRAAGVKHLTTGFFRPEYFYGYGFQVERHFAGLVKSLGPSEAPEP